jgi:hypothetical protein
VLRFPRCRLTSRLAIRPPPRANTHRPLASYRSSKATRLRMRKSASASSMCRVEEVARGSRHRRADAFMPPWRHEWQLLLRRLTLQWRAAGCGRLSQAGALTPSTPAALSVQRQASRQPECPIARHTRRGAGVVPPRTPRAWTTSLPLTPRWLTTSRFVERLDLSHSHVAARLHPARGQLFASPWYQSSGCRSRGRRSASAAGSRFLSHPLEYPPLTRSSSCPVRRVSACIGVAGARDRRATVADWRREPGGQRLHFHAPAAEGRRRQRRVAAVVGGCSP